MVAAVPTFRFGDRPYAVEVCRQDAPLCETVTVVSFCACDRHIIDLAWEPFEKLGGTKLGGVIHVTVTALAGGANPTPPNTDGGTP
jgi:hypothetical protein